MNTFLVIDVRTLDAEQPLRVHCNFAIVPCYINLFLYRSQALECIQYVANIGVLMHAIENIEI